MQSENKTQATWIPFWVFLQIHRCYVCEWKNIQHMSLLLTLLSFIWKVKCLKCLLEMLHIRAVLEKC